MRASMIGLCVAATAALPGCLGEPPIEDRWTKLEILEAAAASAAPGSSVPVRSTFPSDDEPMRRNP